MTTRFIAITRPLGWVLLALGVILFGRAAWLMALYYGNMSEMSRQRGFIALAVTPCIAMFGWWLASRRPPMETRS